MEDILIDEKDLVKEKKEENNVDVRLSFSITKEENEKLKKIAEKCKRSKAGMVRFLIDHYYTKVVVEGERDAL